VTLWITAAAGDAQLHVLLEEVAGDEVRYVTEGVMRAALRRLGEPPYEVLGLPWHRCYEEDLEPVPSDDPVEVVLDLAPTATVFDAGHRLRLTVTGADADNTSPSGLDPDAFSVHRGPRHPSRLELPVIGE
jgi:uncharacterized protein